MLIYSEHNVNMLDLSIDFCGYEDLEPSYSYGPSVRNNYVLHYITHGTGTFYYNHENFALEAGDLFLLKPNEMTYYVANSSDPWSYYWIGISGTKLEDLLSLSKINETAILKYSQSKKTKTIGNLIKEIVLQTESNLTQLDYIKAYSYLYSIMYELGKAYPNPLRENKIKHDYFSQIKNYIDQNYHNNIDIQSIADQLNINRSYLSVLFKKNIGLSPKKYMMDVRMKRASQLLFATKMTINEIAFSVGYNDQVTFSKAFKNYFLLTPSQYRKSTQK
ncbi:AraC family ligand binding domain-containing protein [Alkalibacterium sp. s-m-22]|uniref:AraC family ligand binding domain-containing protein n=2 Tax=Alkalibacterium indicireducens TaxID=398758 RepID=A0ABP3K9Z2_9LACT